MNNKGILYTLGYEVFAMTDADNNSSSLSYFSFSPRYISIAFKRIMVGEMYITSVLLATPADIRRLIRTRNNYSTNTRARTKGGKDIALCQTEVVIFKSLRQKICTKYSCAASSSSGVF